MVNIGLLGDVSVGKTSILRLFVRYLKKGDIEKVKVEQNVQLLKLISLEKLRFQAEKKRML